MPISQKIITAITIRIIQIITISFLVMNATNLQFYDDTLLRAMAYYNLFAGKSFCFFYAQSLLDKRLNLTGFGVKKCFYYEKNVSFFS